ncbi:MAG TPA: VWA domain-containing protein [Myxococcota bacterium]|nr:VWA domain-containing protein [Myxococcota bacterium]
MIELARPWVLLLLPLPALAWWLLPRASETGAGALRVPFYEALRALPAAGGAGVRARSVLVLGAKILAWALLVLAAAQPQWIGDPVPVQTSGRDMMLALDLSQSMEREDFELNGRAVTRHEVVSQVAKRFLEAREGDRVGLILFGSRAYLQAPITPDRETVAQLVAESEIGLAGKETAIGDAIGLAVKHLRERPADQRVLILLSDGASNAGVADPVQAAKLAHEAGVRIYTIGVGAESTIVQTPFGARVLSGAQDLDEETLSKVAELTGGLYFRARDTEGLVHVYQQIDQLEPTLGDAAVVRPTRALFHWPLAGALALTGVLAACSALLPLAGRLAAERRQRAQAPDGALRNA